MLKYKRNVYEIRLFSYYFIKHKYYSVILNFKNFKQLSATITTDMTICALQKPSYELCTWHVPITIAPETHLEPECSCSFPVKQHCN